MLANEPAARNGRVKQSVVFWCFNARGEKWDADKTCRVAKDLGCPSVEIIGPEHWNTLKKYGLTCAIAPNGMPGAPFMRGFNNPAFHAENLERTGKMIDACAEAKFPSVISFFGYKWKNPEDPKSGEIGRDEGVANCVKGLKELARVAEQKGVTVCVEHLNTRDSSDPMKGHPGYQGDDLEFCAEVIRKVGSPRVKLLFDIYHVQIMHGDLIRRIDQLRDMIGHVHTAGVPGRGELDAGQEINYPAVIKKLMDVGYAGYVGQEFIPTHDPLAGLTQAVKACDV
jgi:hydroxypyruvate isomerase